MSLAPTIRTVNGIFAKLEREARRAWQSDNPIDTADHFFNFCITAAALRDYFFERKHILEYTAKKPYHDLWDATPVMLATREVANTTKHRVLRFSNGKRNNPRTRSAKLGSEAVVNVLMNSSEMRVVPGRTPSVSITLSTGRICEMWEFFDEVMEYWKTYLRANGIRVRRTP